MRKKKWKKREIPWFERLRAPSVANFSENLDSNFSQHFLPATARVWWNIAYELRKRFKKSNFFIFRRSIGGNLTFAYRRHLKIFKNHDFSKSHKNFNMKVTMTLVPYICSISVTFQTFKTHLVTTWLRKLHFFQILHHIWKFPPKWHYLGKFHHYSLDFQHRTMPAPHKRSPGAFRPCKSLQM